MSQRLVAQALCHEPIKTSLFRGKKMHGSPFSSTESTSFNNLFYVHYHPSAYLVGSIERQRRLQDAVKNYDSVSGFCEGTDARRLTGEPPRSTSAAADPIDGHGPGWHPEASLRRSQGPGPYFPEPLRPISSRPQVCQEDGRLAQDEGDHSEGSRMDHQRGQGLRSARPWRCWFSFWSQMGRFPLSLTRDDWCLIRQWGSLS
jgi:hypothetical protein